MMGGAAEGVVELLDVAKIFSSRQRSLEPLLERSCCVLYEGRWCIVGGSGACDAKKGGDSVFCVFDWGLGTWSRSLYGLCAECRRPCLSK